MSDYRKVSSSIISKSLMGKMEVFTRKIENDVAGEEEHDETTFLYLTCDLPPTPLFKNEMMENIIPQVRIRTGYTGSL